jgi:pilus assembly protein Flp/PilA
MRSISKFLKDESGVTAAEYGLILALVAGVIVVAVSVLGKNISTVVNTVAATI